MTDRLSANWRIGVARIVPLYHPAAAFYNPDLKEQILKDIKKPFANKILLRLTIYA